MKFGGYVIVVEGNPPAEYEAIDTLDGPVEGREMVIEDSLYIVTKIRTEQDRSARAEDGTLYTYPRVFVRRVGSASDPLPPKRDDGDEPHATASSATVLHFRLVEDRQATDVDELADLKALLAHERTTTPARRRVVAASGHHVEGAGFSRSSPISTTDHQRTDVDELAGERAFLVHEVERLQRERHASRSGAADEQAALDVPADETSSLRMMSPRGSE